MRETIVCNRFKTVGRFVYQADFSQASSHIVVSFYPEEEDSWQPVPFQVADCRHDRMQCERMIAEYFK